MTIFGFNTDVTAGPVVYHVQSEARVNDLLLQTQVFIKGHCIGKRAASYAERTVQQDFSNEEMHELLKTQHRQMIEAVRGGRMMEMFLSDGEIEDVNGTGLALKWLNPEAAPADGRLVIRLHVRDGGAHAEGALLTARLELTPDAPIHSQSITEEDGVGELEIAVSDHALAEIAFLVRAKSDEKSVTRKFRLKR